MKKLNNSGIKDKSKEINRRQRPKSALRRMEVK